MGLGNPGPEYAKTRHNIGYMVIEQIALVAGSKFGKHRRAHADVADSRVGTDKIELLRSRTYMNESGGPVKAAADYAHIPVDHIVVVHDELDIPFGSIRVKQGGGEGGHNGLKSIKKSMGSPEFYRVRIGVGRPPGRQDPADYVLKPFSGAERSELPLIIDRAAEAVESLITQGLAATQNIFNGS